MLKFYSNRKVFLHLFACSKFTKLLCTHLALLGLLPVIGILGQDNVTIIFQCHFLLRFFSGWSSAPPAFIGRISQRWKVDDKTGMELSDRYHYIILALGHFAAVVSLCFVNFNMQWRWYENSARRLFSEHERLILHVCGKRPFGVVLFQCRYWHHERACLLSDLRLSCMTYNVRTKCLACDKMFGVAMLRICFCEVFTPCFLGVFRRTSVLNHLQKHSSCELLFEEVRATFDVCVRRCGIIFLFLWLCKWVHFYSCVGVVSFVFLDVQVS